VQRGLDENHKTPEKQNKNQKTLKNAQETHRKRKKRETEKEKTHTKDQTQTTNPKPNARPHAKRKRPIQKGKRSKANAHAKAQRKDRGGERPSLSQRISDRFDSDWIMRDRSARAGPLPTPMARAAVLPLHLSCLLHGPPLRRCACACVRVCARGPFRVLPIFPFGSALWSVARSLR